jgi:hypothetical protein
VNDRMVVPMSISVEVLMLLADDAGRWSYRQVDVVPAPGESPDQAARRGCGLAADADSTVVHSTSWRYVPDGRVILTYAVCPDPVPDAPRAVLAGVGEVAIGPAPAVPAPERIEVENVVAHAVRHLALLLITDPVVRRTLRRRPAIEAALARCSPLGAGELAAAL